MRHAYTIAILRWLKSVMEIISGGCDWEFLGERGGVDGWGFSANMGLWKMGG